MTVGVRCASGCRLTGLPIVVRDAAGTAVGAGRLGEAPSPRTRALYAAEVPLVAPQEKGVHAWTAGVASSTLLDGNDAARTGEGSEAVDGPEAPGAELEAEHVPASSPFSFRTTGPPDHRVTVTVCDREAEAPIDGAEVRIGLCHAATDAAGRAVLDVPAGEHAVSTRKAGYEPHADRVTVARDVALRIVAVRASDADLDDDQVWM